MDPQLKERLIGAAVLVALAVWLIPWILDGPPPEAPAEPGEALALPALDEAPALRTQTIDLSARRGIDTAAPVVSPPVAVDVTAARREAEGRAPGEAVRDAAASAAPARAKDAADGPARTFGSAHRAPARDVAAPAASAAEASASAASSQATQSDAPALNEATTRAAPTTHSAAPAAPEPSGEATEPRMTAGDWAVQLGSFGERQNAERLARRVASFGADPEVTTTRAAGRTMYRVRVGPHATRAQAEAAASSLSAHGFVAQVVTVE